MACVIRGGSIFIRSEHAASRAGPQWRRQPGNQPPPISWRSENTYRKKNANKQALSVANALKRSQGRVFRRSRRRSQHQGLAQELRRRADGSATPAAAGEAGACLSEETARKGGQRRERPAKETTCEISPRTMIGIFIGVRRDDYVV